MEQAKGKTVTALASGLVRVLAPNPSALTFHGTNSYLVGHEAFCVIDPGPDDPAHRAALLEVIGPRRVVAIVVTHAHKDHSALAPGWDKRQARLFWGLADWELRQGTGLARGWTTALPPTGVWSMVTRSRRTLGRCG
jgi:glyoxylase-like metal-dependent hydrolase (beta-lactamase superfamily II)